MKSKVVAIDHRNNLWIYQYPNGDLWVYDFSVKPLKRYKLKPISHRVKE